MVHRGRRYHRLELKLWARALLAGWRPEKGYLFLPAATDRTIGDHIAARIGIVGYAPCITVFGIVTLVRRLGRPSIPPGVEIVLHPSSIPAAHYLALVALGKNPAFCHRSPRWLAVRSLITLSDGVRRVGKTVNVSQDGCALIWSGSPPPLNHAIELKISDEFFGSSARGVVCWREMTSVQPRLGLQMTGSRRDLNAWRRLVQVVASSGAPAT